MDLRVSFFIGVRSTLIWSIKGGKGYGGLPHTGVPEIVSPPYPLPPLIGINVDLTPVKKRASKRPILSERVEARFVLN